MLITPAPLETTSYSNVTSGTIASPKALHASAVIIRSLAARGPSIASVHNGQATPKNTIATNPIATGPQPSVSPTSAAAARPITATRAGA